MVKTQCILFVCYGGGHINALLPVIRACLERQEFRVEVLALTTAGVKLRGLGVKFRGFQDFVDSSQDGEALKLGQELVQELDLATVPRMESVAYLGLSYQDLRQRLGVEKAAAQYQSRGRQAFLPLSILRRIFDQIEPDLVVATNSPRAEQAALEVAQERKIPSLCLVDLFGVDCVWICRPQHGSKICVISEHVRQWLMEKGRPASEIVVTGNPAFDTLAKTGLKQSAVSWRKSRGWENKVLVLWIAQREPDPQADLPSKIEAELCNISRRRPNWQILFRPHPNWPREYTDLPCGVTISGQDYDLHTLLHAVDVVLTMTSTVGLEAVLIDKPLVTIDLSLLIEFAPYSALGMSFGVQDLDVLESAIVEALLRPRDSAKIAVPPGTATAAVLNEMEQLLLNVAKK